MHLEYKVIVLHHDFVVGSQQKHNLNDLFIEMMPQEEMFLILARKEWSHDE